MAKTNITQYSSTPSENTDIDDINIDEGCPASGLNNALRSLLSHLKNVDTGSQALTALSVTGDTTISSGNLLVGKTSSNLSTAGSEFASDGLVRFTRSNVNAVVNFNKLNNDGDIVSFRKDDTQVGSIGTNGGRPFFINPTYGGLKIGTGYSVDPATTAGAGWDNSVDLGAGGTRWKDLYLSGGVYLGGTGSANKLSDYETGTWSPTVTGAATAGTATFSGTQDGFYVKVGSLVTVSFSYTTTAHTGTGKIRIGGLPFASTSSSGYQAVGTFMANNYDFSDSSPINGNLYLQREVSYLRIYLTRDNTGWIEQDLNAAHGLIASITYRTDS